MSDERDETRRFSPIDDAAADSPDGDDTFPGRRLDDTMADGEGADDAVADGDATRVTPRPDATELDATRQDATRSEAGRSEAGRSDATRPDATRSGATRPDATSVMPASDDWAPSRANPVWSGRAEVRAPQPGRSRYELEWPTGPQTPVRRDRWWMPIVVGIVVLVMLALLGWGIYMIVQNANRETPTPAPTTTAATTAPTTAATTETTTPTTAPATTTPTTTPSTTEPTTTEVRVPALRGLTVAEAQAALTRTGLSTRVIFRDGDAPAGTVIDSDPREGQEVPPDTTVTLIVSAEDTPTTPTGTTTTTTGPTDGPGVGGN